MTLGPRGLGPLGGDVTLCPRLGQRLLPRVTGRLDGQVRQGEPLDVDHVAAHTCQVRRAVNEHLQQHRGAGGAWR